MSRIAQETRECKDCMHYCYNMLSGIHGCFEHRSETKPDAKVLYIKEKGTCFNRRRSNVRDKKN